MPLAKHFPLQNKMAIYLKTQATNFGFCQLDGLSRTASSDFEQSRYYRIDIYLISLWHFDLKIKKLKPSEIVGFCDISSQKKDSRNINQNNPQRQRLDRVNVPSDRPMGAVESEKISFRYKNWPWVLHYSWFEIKFSKTSSNSQLSRNIRHAPLTFFRASFFSPFAIQKTKMESFVECSVGGVSVDEWLIQRVTSSSTICAYFYGWWEKIEICKNQKWSGKSKS